MDTLSMLSFICSATVAALLTWIIRSTQAHASQAALEAQLEASRASETRLQTELNTSAESLRSATERLHSESTARASAQAKADTIPSLEAQLNQLAKTRDEAQSEAVQLAATSARTAESLRSATEQLEKEITRSTSAESRAQSLNQQVQELGERKAAFESEASRIPELERRLLTAERAAEEHAAQITRLTDLQGRAESALNSERESLIVVRKELSEARSQLSTSQQVIIELTADKTDLTTRLETERDQSHKETELLKEFRTSFSDNFKALSDEALKSNNQAFLDLANTTMERFRDSAKGDLEAREKAVDQLVKPIADSLQKVDGKLGELEKARLASYSELNAQLKGLVETHLPGIRNETANLVKALRQPTVRGRWGELQLKRVVEMAGMLDHCDFIEQDTRATDEGRQIRPDLVVRLPGGRDIIIDAKAPISAYLEATEATDEQRQRALMTQHAQQVRTHIDALGRKNYWDEFSDSPDFVVMFIPGEVFFSAALQEDPSLIECGVNRNVIPATPTTLIALLRAVAYGWCQEKLAKNAAEIASLGKELYERISKLGEHWGEMGDRLGKAVDAYNKSVSTLESRVLVSARRFRDLKVGTEGREIDTISPIEIASRALQAEELVIRHSSTLPNGSNELISAQPTAAKSISGSRLEFAP